MSTPDFDPCARCNQSDAMRPINKRWRECVFCRAVAAEVSAPPPSGPSREPDGAGVGGHV